LHAPNIFHRSNYYMRECLHNTGDFTDATHLVQRHTRGIYNSANLHTAGASPPPPSPAHPQASLVGKGVSQLQTLVHSPSPSSNGPRSAPSEVILYFSIWITI
jgi:hypothetical protein